MLQERRSVLVTLAIAVAALSCATDDSPVEPVPDDTEGVPRTTTRLAVLSGDSQVGYTDELLAAPLLVGITTLLVLMTSCPK